MEEKFCKDCGKRESVLAGSGGRLACFGFNDPKTDFVEGLLERIS